MKTLSKDAHFNQLVEIILLSKDQKKKKSLPRLIKILTHNNDKKEIYSTEKTCMSSFPYNPSMKRFLGRGKLERIFFISWIRTRDGKFGWIEIVFLWPNNRKTTFSLTVLFCLSMNSTKTHLACHFYASNQSLPIPNDSPSQFAKIKMLRRRASFHEHELKSR